MKFLFGLILSTITFTSAFAGIWDVDTKEEVEKQVAKMKANPQWPAPDYQEKCFVALIGKSSENMTYEEFKAVFKNNFDLLKDKMDKSKVDKDYWKVNLSQAALFAKRFSDFASYVVKDEELKNIPYVKRFYSIYKKNLFTDAERLDSYRSFYKLSNANSFYRDHVWTHHKQLINKMSTEDAIKELKEIKRYTYPLIGKNDQWKNFVVEIELMIKALQ